MSADDRKRRADVVDTLLDLVVYAPIGLTLDAQAVAPDLARRGRQHTAAARQLGELAVRAGMRKLEELVSQMSSEPPMTSAPAPAVEATLTAANIDPDKPTNGPALRTAVESALTAQELPVPGYDLLAASQVVKRLDGLTPSELEAVRRYEEQTRGRRTILNKIARLQA